MPDKDLITLFFNSKKNANCILEIEKGLLSHEENDILSSIEIVEELISKIFEKKMLHDSSVKDASEKKYKDWILTRYEDFITHLLTYLCHTNRTIQIRSLEALIKFITLEGKYPLANVNQKEWYFPKLLFQRIIGEIISDTLDQHDLIKKFKQFTSFVDVRLYTLKAVAYIMEQKEEVNDIFLFNCFYLLILCSPSSEKSSTLLSQEDIENPFMLKEKIYLKLFSTTWYRFLKYELPLSLLKKVLVVLPKKVMPHFQNPCLLTDFLTDLYNKGGLTSLLALSGLFELMQKYNVEYPDFYLKLYSLFEVDIVNGSFSPRFFYLSDLFLSSTHLPAYMVAAFAKRLSRISLSSRPDCIFKIIPLISNLLIRHPALMVLIHKTEPKELSEDPYDFTLTDPSESKAMDSSLWEIKTLQTHINPDISRKAKSINHELPKLEFDLSAVLDISMDCVYRKERKRKFTEVPTAIEQPSKIKNFWSISSELT